MLEDREIARAHRAGAARKTCSALDFGTRVRGLFEMSADSIDSYAACVTSAFAIRWHEITGA